MNTTIARSAGPTLAALAALVAGPACSEHDHPHDTEGEAHGHPTPAGDDHGHDHGGGEAVSITAWTDALELFAEHPPAVSGHALPFLAHLTVLDGFAPVRAGTVTLILQGPVKAEARVEAPLRPGIFRPTLPAPEPGTYWGRLEVESPQLSDTIDGFQIVVHPTHEAAASPTDHGDEAISFLKEQQWQVPFATAFATEGTVIPTVEVAGEITTPPSGRADVGAAIAGRVISPKGGLPRPGETVRRGQLLATIAPAPAEPEAGARAELAVVEAEARLQAARAAFARAERLLTDRAIPERQLEEARREVGVAEEAVRATRRARDVFAGARSGRGGGSYRVTAPIDGVVVSVEATEGQSVQGGDPLFHVVDLTELWIHARVPEQQAIGLRSDEDAAFRLPGMSDWLSLDIGEGPNDAWVVNIGRTVDPRSRTVDVIYGLRSPDARLRVGALVRVAVPVGDPWTGVVVPRAAVLQDDGRSLVYVQVEGESFEARVARVGPRGGDRVGLLRGVDAGERVVTEGANVLRLTSRAGTAPAHGHVH